MTDNISILRAGQAVGLKTFDFPAGEIGVKIDGAHWTYAGGVRTPYQTVAARIQSSRDLMALIMITDALRRIDDTPIRLILPYVPYARQDRVCVNGEAFSLRVFANLINGLGYEKVTVLDPHSDVVGALFDNLTIKTQVQIVNEWPELTARLRAPDVVLVSPDAGANKKTAALAGYLGHRDYLRADKKRDLDNGKIIETLVYADDLSGQTIAIVDDICDGAASFIALAKTLKEKKAKAIWLYVTHGIFSKGLDVVFESGIDKVFTTNSFRDTYDPRVTVFKIDDIVRNT